MGHLAQFAQRVDDGIGNGLSQRCIGPDFLLHTEFESCGESTGSFGFNSRLGFNSKRLANTP